MINVYFLAKVMNNTKNNIYCSKISKILPKNSYIYTDDKEYL